MSHLPLVKDIYAKFGAGDVPAVLATPVAIFADNVNDVIADGYQTYADVCTGLEDLCTEYGVVDRQSKAPDATCAVMASDPRRIVSLSLTR